jgi:hypothetical protein
MPTIEVPLPSYTTIEVDLSDHLSEIEVDIDEDVIRQAIDSGDVDIEEVLSAIDDSDIVAHLEAGNVILPDATLVDLLRGRNDLVKLALSGDLTVAEQAQQLVDRVVDQSAVELFAGGQARELHRVLRCLVRSLLCVDSYRGAITDALGEHYAKVPLESLVPEVVEAPSVTEAAN